MRRAFWSLGLVGLGAAGFAAQYEIRLDARTQTAEVSISVAQPGKLAFHMPVWIPGDYQAFNYGQNVVAIQFRNGGRVIEAQRDGLNRWVAAEEADRVLYRVKSSSGNFSDNLAFRGSATYVCGGGVFGWIEGHDKEGHELEVFPGAGERVYGTLPRREGSGERFTARDYVHLTDSPMVVGSGVRELDGKIRIVAYGDSAGANLAGYQELGTKVAEESAKMLPGSIGEKYTFFFDFGGGGGGLEHGESTRIGLWTKNVSQARGIMFHEYLHAYNVKRIRPEAIWNFDFTKTPVIDSLWWLEGVTDYYSEVMAVRCGLLDQAAFLRMVGNNSVRERNRAATMRVSALESSRRVFEGAGSQGFGGLSYYSKGWLIGAALDLSIRVESGGKHSLDDVVRGLWANALAGKGYPESMIRELCVKYGGEATGVVYDESVTKPQPVPLVGLLEKAGLRFEGSSVVVDAEAGGTAKAVAERYPLALAVP